MKEQIHVIDKRKVSNKELKQITIRKQKHENLYLLWV